jgi:hypothetical protein
VAYASGEFGCCPPTFPVRASCQVTPLAGHKANQLAPG